MTPSEAVAWIGLSYSLGLLSGALIAAIAAGVLRRIVGAIINPPEREVEREVDRGRAYDLDDAEQRQKFEALLARRNGGRP